MYLHVLTTLFLFPICLSLQNDTSNRPNLTDAALQSSASMRQLTQAAPYALDDDKLTRSLVIRLAINPPDTDSTRDSDPWTFLNNKNGTHHGASLNLKRLLETLSNNNFTSEIVFDNQNTSLVNITISNLAQSNKTSTDEQFLEDLLIEANSKIDLSGNSVVKDNHRYESRHPARSKQIFVDTIMTPPSIRKTIDVIAENYTMKKISEEANVFAIKLLHQQNIEQLGGHNIVQSPFAVYQGLTLLFFGATGDTGKELDKVLLGSQSSYENTKLTHDQDRHRLLVSLSDVVHQLHNELVNHWRSTNEAIVSNSEPSVFGAGSIEQHFIVANNLLFSPSAYEISNEFKNHLNIFYNNTAMTKIEIGSTESILNVNSWIRRSTAGAIPSVFDKKCTFDEYNVMTLLSTSWLAQRWKDKFYKIISPLRSNIRLKGQGKSIMNFFTSNQRTDNLLEFIDDNKHSHFVEYIKSKPTRNILHFRPVINGQVTDVVVVPFHDSTQCLIVLSPMQSSQVTSETTVDQSSNLADNANGTSAPPDSSPLSKLIANIASNPRKAMRTVWNLVAPELITRNNLQAIQSARPVNTTIDSYETSLSPLVQLSIPLIRFEMDSSLLATLNHIGIVNSFDPNQANFIGINGHPFNYHKLHLSNVLYKTKFNLNEQGINYDKTIKTLESLRIFSNSHKTAIFESGDTSLPKAELVDEVKLDRPFLYLICDTKTRLIIYTGVLRNPKQEGSP